MNIGITVSTNYIAIRKFGKNVGHPSCSSDVKLTEYTKKYVSETFETNEGNCEDSPFRSSHKRCSVKKAFLKISHERSFVRVSF